MGKLEEGDRQPKIEGQNLPGEQQYVYCSQHNRLTKTFNAYYAKVLITTHIHFSSQCFGKVSTGRSKTEFDAYRMKANVIPLRHFNNTLTH